MALSGKKRYHRLWWRFLGWTFPSMDPSEDPHSTVDLEGIPIDRGIEEIIRYLWDLGIETANSCQGDLELERISGQRRFYEAIVTFVALEDAQNFVGLIERSRVRPFELGDRDVVQISFSPQLRGEPIYYHVSFPPSLISRLLGAIRPSPAR